MSSDDHSLCLTADDLGDLLVADDDPRWAHVAACPRCRSLVASYRSFVAGNQDLADATAEAELGRRFGTFLADEDRKVIRRHARIRPILGVAAAMAAVLALVVVMDPWSSDEPVPLIRGDGPAQNRVVAHPATRQDTTTAILAWAPWDGAETYRVLLFAGDLTELARVEAGSDTLLMLTLPTQAEPPAEGRDFYWQVQAIRLSSVVAESAIEVLPEP